MAYYCNIAIFGALPDVSSGQNILHYIMKIFIAGGKFADLIIYVIEGFLRTENFKNIFKKSVEVQKILRENFLQKINFENLRRKFFNSTILSAFFTTLLEGVFLYRNISRPNIFYLSTLRVVRTFITNLLLIRFWFYVNFVNLHLDAILEVLNQNFLEFSRSEFECVRRLNAIRKCYILALEMARELTVAVWSLTTIHVLVTVVSCVRRLYRLYSIFQGALEVGQLNCEC